MESQFPNPTINSPPIFNLFVRLLSGKSLALQFSSPIIHADEIKHRLFEITRIPPHYQRLLTGARQINEDSIISCSGESPRTFPTVHLLLRLLGGKGGFGSLLRGAATKAGQKKTNNFDACRDMSGRRLRHVNAEKRLEEWRAEEEGRRLEKVAEEFLKKNAKVGKKGTGDGEALKYVEKYRKESARCVAEVEESVREAIKVAANGKRKGAAEEKEAKKMKIWMGKRKLGESDGDDTDEDFSDDEEEKKSVILNNENRSGSDREAEGSLGSVSGGKLGKCSGGSSSESGSENEKEVVLQGSGKSNGYFGGASHQNKLKNVTELMIDDQGIAKATIVSCSILGTISDSEVVAAEECGGIKSGTGEDKIGQPHETIDSNEGDISECMPVEIKSGTGEDKIGQPHETIDSNEGDISERMPVEIQENCSLEFDSSVRNPEVEKPINIDDFNSAEEIEVLGLERLKSELQARGLKCGGTLQERGSRLFMLKTTPLDKLPKKLLAKK